MITRSFLAGLKFRVMDETDRFAFQGCESPVSLMAEDGDNLIIIDGSYCEVVSMDGETLAQCEDISKLAFFE